MRGLGLAGLVLVCAALAHGEIVPVTKDEAARWLYHLVPLPHEIALPQKAVIAPQDVSFRLRTGAGDVEQQALTELRELFREKTGTVPKGNAFEILIGVLDDKGRIEGIAVEHVDRLKGLPHNNQAYVIQRSGDNRLVIAALTPNGAYHGVQTLIQLLQPSLRKDQVAIPLASVVDWPDMDERGLWNFDLNLLPYLSSLKLNFAKVPAPPEKIEKGKPVRAKVRGTTQFPNVLEAARRRAITTGPNVKHLNYIGHVHKVYELYPETAGKGDGAVPKIWYKPRQIRVPCCHSPIWRRIIAEYMSDLASKGAQEVSVWLTEFEAQCQCPACLEAGQLRMETTAAIEGWREAQKQHPDLVLRIFYCMGGKSLEDTYQILKELPPEVKIERCYGTFGEAFDRIAAEGRWLGSYAGPPLTRGELSGLRFYGGTRTRDYVRRLLDRKWSAVYSINYVYSTGAYQRELFDFHVNALAEWTWNPDGRSLKDLARAWATRAGHAQPEKAAEWVEIMDPIEHACEYPLKSRAWEKLSEMIDGRKPPQFNHDVFGGIRSAKNLDEQLAACDRALAIAREMKAEELVLETQYAAALIRCLKTLHTLLAQTAGAQPRQQLDATLSELRKATQDMVTAMNAKTDLLKSEPRDYAAKIKALHVELWKKRVDPIAAAIGKIK